MPSTSSVQLSIPTDDALMALLGRLAVAHGNMELTQIMCLKIIERLSPSDAVNKYRKEKAWKVRANVRTLLSSSALKSPEKQVVEDLLVKSGDLSDKRNKLLHRFWGQAPDGSWVTSAVGDSWEPLPSKADIDTLVADITAHVSVLNTNRLTGEIANI
jgi:hypothetical protein